MFSHGIAFEALTRLLQELRGEGEIALGTGDVDVAEIGGQLRQQALHVRAALVPGQ